MSIAQQKEIEDLKQRVAVLEQRLDQFCPPAQTVSGQLSPQKPGSTLTLPEKRKSA